MSSTKERIEYFDILRGIAIFAVVAIHVSGVGLKFDADSFNFNFTILWRNALNFCVPLFVVISGYFLANKDLSGKSDYIDFLKKQISKIYFPMLIWSSVWLLINVLVFQSSFPKELVKLLAFSSSVPYYFVALIIQFYLVLPLLQRVVSKSMLCISIGVSLSMTIFVFYIRYYQNINLPVVVYGGNLFTYIMFFTLGLYMGKNSIAHLSGKALFCVTLICYALSCIESYALIEAFGQVGDSVTAIKPSSFLYSFFFIIFLFRMKGRISSIILSKVGRMSFGIYLTHLFLLMFVTKIISRFYPSLFSITALYQLLVTVLIVSGCYLAMRVFNDRVSNKVGVRLGFF
ncbi:acyltransferase [Photobacterium leiognathi]|uniref:acyltransferase n=1 Tax=Photobacterium leiognathi TaxID=553611 RepID=UPI002980FB05|nr:acyltransferase [Photobacterium leiognathi]